ncbi:hypothetical protein QJS10_CPB15g00768 [Acorus calamus]|uniref:Uncharacterized protein n=1 Tax=Acorus calamus TaxID=4465 RepID=A0AAV9D992_ACOCL|nr:hypothetical protein QJS10_CPB15g00768 [Acorus calamus]
MHPEGPAHYVHLGHTPKIRHTYGHGCLLYLWLHIPCGSFFTSLLLMYSVDRGY